MTAKPPPIPPEQRAMHDDGRVDIEAPENKGDAGLNLDEQGRYGNRRQNVDAVQHKVQDR